MARKAIQRAGGSTAEHSTFTGLAREISIDTDKKVAVVHDGSTAGGFPLARRDQVVGLSGTETVTGDKTFTGLNTIQALKEKVTITAGAPASTQNFDVLTQAVQYFTSNNANNWTLNVRGDSSNSLDSIMSTSQSITIEVIVTNGGTAYRHTAMTIDGNAVTPQWLGAAAPSAGTVNKRDTYTFQIIKTGSATFIVQATFAAGN